MKTLVLSAISCLIFSLNLLAEIHHEFALEFNAYENQSLTSQNRMKGFLKDVEAEISPGVAFAINKVYQVTINQENNASLSCQNIGLHIEISLEGIKISKPLERSIISFDIFHKLADCYPREIFINELENKILDFEGQENLETWPSHDIDRQNLRTCIRELRRARGLSERRAIREYEPCIPYFETQNRKRDMERYLNRRADLTRGIPLEIDVTSLHNEGFAKFRICNRDYNPTVIAENGDKIKMLGYAFVYYAPGFGTSQFGHVGERFVFCQNDELKSILFDYGPYKDDKDFNFVKNELYPSFFSSLSQDYRNQIENTNFIRRIINPTLQNLIRDTNFRAQNESQLQTRNYGFFQTRNNRDMIEIWLDTPEGQKLAAFRDANRYYNEQTENLQNQIPLDRYQLFTNNCTHALMDRFSQFTDGEYEVSELFGFNPVWLFEILKKKSGEKMILYPSQRTLRKLEMLDSGKSLFWENISFLSRASEGKAGNPSSFFLIYPEYSGPLKRAILYPVSGAINLIAGLVQGLKSILSIPFNWIRGERSNELQVAKNNILHSLTEILGVRMRFPAPTQWSEDELFYLEHIVPEQAPKTVPLFIKNLHR